MDLLERGFLLTVGAILGYILARIVDYLRVIKEEVDEVLEIEKKHDRGEEGFMQVNRILTDLLYLVVLTITLFGVWRAEQALNQAEEAAAAQEKGLCEAGTETRDVQRGIVDAIYSLALGFTIRDTDDPEMTPQEEEELEAYITSLDIFREGLYERIVPSDICAPYVTDDDVKPTVITIDDLLKQQGETND